MNIDGMIINADVEDVLERLKEQLADEGVFLFAKFSDSGADVMCCCPYHKNGQERRPSAGIRKSDGLFHCLACGETHSLPEVIGHCFHSDALYGYNWLRQNFNADIEQQRIAIDLNLNRNTVQQSTHIQYIEDTELDRYRYVHPYMYERGLTDEIIEKFDIGYDKTTDSITFPVRDANGNCLFVARRSVKTKFFELPKGITKPLYGMYELTHTQGFGVTYPVKLYVCEGLFDCLRLWCNNKLAVAGFGCLFNNYQIKQIQDLPIRSVVLALDNDEAGWKANERLRRFLTNKVVTEVELPVGKKDVGECSDSEIQNLKEKFV